MLTVGKVEDWYSIGASDLASIGFPASMTKTKMLHLLSEKYPKHVWDPAYLLRGRYAEQRRLEKVIRSLFTVIRLSS